MIKLRTKKKASVLVSLTSLIDVVFILLIFFMLISSFLAYQRQSLYLSQSTGTLANDESDVKVISVHMYMRGKEVAFQLNKQPISWLSLERHLKSNRQHRVVLNPSSKIIFQDFLRVKERVEQLGISNVSGSFPDDKDK